ncbi:MAG: reverse transcriptase domain-containing protein, partial [Candidatus Magasanikbacteria bacterium]|nr:reverse transcriptase domain-containing protein [Candidatus Magasanikbacteria bacterium]
MKIQLGHIFEEIISVENLCAAWGEFLNGKRGKADVQEFGRRLADNIVQLHSDLADGSYRHGGYYAFRIADPKPREIHKASVRDRLVHHAIYRILYPFFDRTFIADSFSCRDGKGVHRALRRFDCMARSVSQNHHRTAWILKCDIRKFFASINHEILVGIL